MKLYGLKNCDTCRKALKALENVAFVDVRADGVPADLLADWLEEVGSDALINRRSTTWRGLSEAEKGAAAGEGAAALLAEHPTLMKRPVIVAEGAVHVGWTKEVQTALL